LAGRTTVGAPVAQTLATQTWPLGQELDPRAAIRAQLASGKDESVNAALAAVAEYPDLGPEVMHVAEANASWIVRSNAAYALGRMRDARWSARLAALAEKDRQVRGAAVQALLQIDTPEAVAAVEALRGKLGGTDAYAVGKLLDDYREHKRSPRHDSGPAPKGS
jgi:HEAT repeat protein